MRCSDIDDHFRARAPWVDGNDTLDGFKYGYHDRKVTGIAVCWQALRESIEEARDLDCNLLITHESLFYTSRDDDEGQKNTEPGLAKRLLLDDAGITVYRCHDAWDVFPGIGIVDAWSEFLGLGKPVGTQKFYNLHEIPTLMAWELVQIITERVKELGQQAIEFTGDMHAAVDRVAVGTGAITDFRVMHAMGADFLVGTDDGFRHTREGAWARDLGLPYCVVNHATAEIPGLLNLVTYLKEQFPDVPVKFVGPQCLFSVRATALNDGINVRMVQSLPADPVRPELPEGYELSAMQAGQEQDYLDVMNDSIYAGNCDAEWFTRTFANDPEYRPDYILLIRCKGEAVAGAAAWHGRHEDDEAGRVHFVGVKKAHRGKGLGKLITQAAIARIRERGFDQVILDTQHWRLPAIRAYLRQGFRPYTPDDEAREVWERIMETIKKE